jgi:hypothetical protein
VHYASHKALLDYRIEAARDARAVGALDRVRGRPITRARSAVGRPTARASTRSSAALDGVAERRVNGARGSKWPRRSCCSRSSFAGRRGRRARQDRDDPRRSSFLDAPRGLHALYMVLDEWAPRRGARCRRRSRPTPSTTRSSSPNRRGA